MRTRALSPRSLPLLAALALLLPGCTLLADWFCWDVRVELHLDDSPRESWKIPRLSVSVVLLGKDDLLTDTVPEFEDKAALEEWFTDRNFGQLARLRRLGRVVDLELEVGRTAGLQEIVRLSRGDLEVDGTRVVVVANFATANFERQRLEIALADTCRLGVRLHADGTITDITDDIARD